MMLRLASSCVLVGTLVAILPGWYGSWEAIAIQDATLSVTILIVDEKDACAPAGYQNYEDELVLLPRCEPLTPSDVREWIERGVLNDRVEIPPQRIPIGRLLPFLRRYVTIVTGKIDSADRKSAVFLFDWSEPQHFELSFRRESPKNSWIRPLGPVTAQLQGERRWIHHERADSLAPGNGVVWVLAIGEEEIRLRTTGDSDGP